MALHAVPDQGQGARVVGRLGSQDRLPRSRLPSGKQLGVKGTRGRRPKEKTWPVGQLFQGELCDAIRYWSGSELVDVGEAALVRPWGRTKVDMHKTSNACPSCESLEVLVRYQRSGEAARTKPGWIGVCSDCRHVWTVDD